MDEWPARRPADRGHSPGQARTSRLRRGGFQPVPRLRKQVWPPLGPPGQPDRPSAPVQGGRRAARGQPPATAPPGRTAGSGAGPSPGEAEARAAKLAEAAGAGAPPRAQGAPKGRGAPAKAGRGDGRASAGSGQGAPAVAGRGGLVAPTAAAETGRGRFRGPAPAPRAGRSPGRPGRPLRPLGRGHRRDRRRGRARATPRSAATSVSLWISPHASDSPTSLLPAALVSPDSLPLLPPQGHSHLVTLLKCQPGDLRVGGGPHSGPPGAARENREQARAPSGRLSAPQRPLPSAPACRLASPRLP